jgi:hypothetical protein
MRLEAFKNLRSQRRSGLYRSFNLFSEFQRAIDPTLKTYKQPATLRFKVFTCGATLGRSGHRLGQRLLAIRFTFFRGGR